MLVTRQAKPAEYAAALVYLRTEPIAGDALLQWVDGIVRRIHAGELDASGLLICHNGRELLGSIWLMDGLNRTVLAPVTMPLADDVLAKLAEALVSELERRGSTFGMILTTAANPSVPPGFEPITRMLTMRGEPSATAVEPAFTWLPNDPRFDAVFARTLLDSLDVPELDGLRTVDEWKALNRVSAPDPLHWCVLERDGLAVGAAILNPSPPENGCVVWIGLDPAFRGRGWGPVLIRETANRMARSGCRTARLSVDERNQNALRIYTQAGFAIERSHQLFLLRRK